MKKIMTVEDLFSTRDAGVIISGVSPEFDSLNPEEIRRFMNQGVVLLVSLPSASRESGL